MINIERRNRGADKNLDYLEVVHVLVRRQDPRGRALHQAGHARKGDHSAIGLSDQERVEGLVPGTRAAGRPCEGISPCTEVLDGAAAGCCGSFSLPWTLHRFHPESAGLSMPVLVAEL